MSRICKLDIACKHIARRRRTSSTSTRVREVGQGVTKKGVEFRIWQQTDSSSYLHRSIANPATRKSTQLNLGLKELKTAPIKKIVELNNEQAITDVLGTMPLSMVSHIYHNCIVWASECLARLLEAMLL